MICCQKVILASGLLSSISSEKFGEVASKVAIEKFTPVFRKYNDDMLESTKIILELFINIRK